MRGNLTEVTVMHNYRMPFITLLVILLTSVCLAAWSHQGLTYSHAELDEILAPIALYPDPLLAQILPAATYPDELAQASHHIGLKGGARDIDRQHWDVSVKAVSHYPRVLNMMVSKPDWTISIGQAYVYEPDHVMRSIQRLRGRARSHGHLSTNKHQRVYLDSGNIRIVPVLALYIYVPIYNPQVVYVQRRSSVNSNVISFSLGLLIGSWLNRDVDWGHDRVYYHGWIGGGWIGNSRSHVSITNNYYVNNNYRNKPIAVDRKVTTRNIVNYKNKVRSSAGHFQSANYPQSTHAGATPKVTKTRPTTKSHVTKTSPTTKSKVTKTSPTTKSHSSGKSNKATGDSKSKSSGKSSKGH